VVHFRLPSLPADDSFAGRSPQLFRRQPDIHPRRPSRIQGFHRLQGRFNECDDLEFQLEVDPAAKESGTGEPPSGGMGEGPVARKILSALGMETGLAFPHRRLSQRPPLRRAPFVQASGMRRQWVDWDQSLLGYSPDARR
jgi:hypothetical protein